MKRTSTAKIASRLMGDLVVVQAEAEADYHDPGAPNSRTVVAKDVPERSGWVVGCRHLQEGTYEPARKEEWIYGQPSFSVGRQVPVLLVRYWPNLNAAQVPLDGYRLWTPRDPMPVPQQAWVRGKDGR